MTDTLISDLRDLADFLAAHPELPEPSTPIYVNIYVWDKDEYRRLARVFGSAKKGEIDDTTYLRRTFGERTIVLDLNILKHLVCQRIVVGTEEVPEQVIPAHTKEIVEWKCGPILAEAHAGVSQSE